MDQQSHLLAQKPKRSYNLVVIGDGAVGKTCMLITYSKNEFPTEYVPTVFDNYVVTVPTNEGQIELSLKDTAGQEDLASVRKLSYHGAHVFVVCFAVTNPTSFENLPNWVQDIKEFDSRIPFIVVGTKVDEREDKKRISDLRERGLKPITYEEATIKTSSLGGFCYVECSAKTRANLTRVFSDAVTAIVKNSNKMSDSGDSCACLLF